MGLKRSSAAVLFSAYEIADAKAACDRARSYVSSGIVAFFRKIFADHKMVGQDTVITVKVVPIQNFNGFADLLM